MYHFLMSDPEKHSGKRVDRIDIVFAVYVVSTVVRG